MLKTDLRTIAPVSAIATAIHWGCPSVPASTQEISPSSFMIVPRTDSDRPILWDRINTTDPDILHRQKVQARLPQLAQTAQLDRVTRDRYQVEMLDLYPRLKHR